MGRLCISLQLLGDQFLNTYTQQFSKYSPVIKTIIVENVWRKRTGINFFNESFTEYERK